MNHNVLTYCVVLLIFVLLFNEPVIEAVPSTKEHLFGTVQKSATINSVYYVSTTGNDSNSGSSLSPFLSIQRAVKVVNPGDSVIVKDGIYTTKFTYFLNVDHVRGTAVSPVVFKSEHKWGAKFDGQNNTTLNGFFVNYSSYVSIEDFEIYGMKNCGIKVSSISSNTTLRGNKIHDIAKMCSNDAFGHAGMYISTCSNIIVDKNVIYNIGRHAKGENGCIPSNNYWQNNDHGIYIESNVNGLNISYNLIYNCRAGWSIHAYNGEGSLNSNISILNNTFSDPNPNRVGHILLYTNMINTLIANNIFYSPLTAAIQTVSDRTFINCVIKNNITYKGKISYGPTTGFIISDNLDNTNPLFVSPGTYDFNLQASSPAINAGVDVGKITDFSSNEIIGLPDIGAYEYPAQKPAP